MNPATDIKLHLQGIADNIREAYEGIQEIYKYMTILEKHIEGIKD